jgi:plastocyanin
MATATAAWMRLARATALTMVAWAALTTLIARVMIPPVLVVGLIFLAFVPFLKGERRRLGLAYAVVAALALLGNLPSILDELAHPDSLPAFALTLLSFTAALTAIAAGLGAFFRWSPAAIRSLAIAWAAVFVIGAAGSAVVSASAETDVALPADEQVIAEKVTFLPPDLQVESGTAGVWVDNKDGIRHTFTIDELGVDLDIPALKARRVEFQAGPGIYTYRCTVPGHDGMTGTLVVGG